MKKKAETSEPKEQSNEKPANTQAEKGVGTPFNSDDVRLEFERADDERKSKEILQRRRRLIFSTLVILVIGVSVTLLAVWVGKAYQENQLVIAATLTAESLTAKIQSADSLMISGRPDEALLLYNEVKQIDPSYNGVDEKIESANQYIKVMELYSQGLQFMNAGEFDKALEALSRVEQLRPNYKDTQDLVKKIGQDQQVAVLVREMEESYSNQNWQGVIRSYEAIQEIDPFIELPELKDVLFNSYRNVIINLSVRTNLTLEEIEIADKYYRKAIALVPQDKAYAKEREELKKIAVERLANKYYLHALNLIESSNYSNKGLREAIRVLKKADNIGADSPIIIAEIDKAQLFLDAYDNLLQLKWDDAIKILEALLRKDENYADGRAKYFLYEAYTAHGDILLAYADFEGAFIDYQEAEKVAWSDEKNVLRLFQIQVRIAAVLERLDEIDESAEYYNYAFEHLDYKKSLTEPDSQDLLKILTDANQAYQQGDKLEAIRLYETVLEQQEKIYDQITLSVKQGETLVNIAFENGSTIERLRTANSMGEVMIIGANQELLIPVISVIGQ